MQRESSTARTEEDPGEQTAQMVTCDTSEWAVVRTDYPWQWRTPDGATVTVTHTPLKDSRFGQPLSEDVFLELISQPYASTGGAILLRDRVTTDPVPLTLTIGRTTEPPAWDGREGQPPTAYLGHIRVAGDVLVTFSVEACEGQRRGYREALVYQLALSRGQIRPSDDPQSLPEGWSPPKAVKIRPTLAEYPWCDSLFPLHPLTIVRRTLRDIAATVAVSKTAHGLGSLRSLPLTLPPPAPAPEAPSEPLREVAILFGDAREGAGSLEPVVDGVQQPALPPLPAATAPASAVTYDVPPTPQPTAPSSLPSSPPSATPPAASPGIASPSDDDSPPAVSAPAAQD